MKKVVFILYVCVIGLVSIPEKGNAQCFRWQPEYEELTDARKTAVEEWSKLQDSVFVSWGSTDVRYVKTEIPRSLVRRQLWKGRAWSGERVNAQAFIRTLKDLKQVEVSVSDLEAAGGGKITAQHVNAGFVRYVMTDELNKDKRGTCGYRPDRTLFDSSLVADVIDRTVTPMGGRLLKQWIALPIKDVARLNRRLDVVERFRGDDGLREEVGGILERITDLERLSSRIATQRITPREMVQLKLSLGAVADLRRVLLASDDAALASLAEGLDLCEEQRERIEKELFPDPQNNQIQKGGIIADGVDLELDDLRRIACHGKDVIAEIQRRESEATGIPSLKVSFNNVFGYYIEVRNTHKDKVPADWIRKQTLTSAERYITQELKEYEEKILGAEEKMLAIEQRIYAGLVEFLSRSIAAFQRDAAVVARADCLRSFAVMAAERRYCRPRTR